ncbi:MAG: NAD(P)-dependent alcohol dehydrogenase [Myxococcales bacterium]|nr:NAD(P)-dependent alcohol dehydrogenase [Myxococcales bacterium]MDH3484354.1 NAD(P)-dependent alcohol dehydrogenase [Myxococcales bacterium]
MSALPQYGKHLHPQEKMRAIVIDKYGGPDVLREATVPRPVPKRDQVLVRTRFIGVNPKDVVVRKGKFQVATGRRFPLIIGHDIAGEVVEAGVDADLAVGEAVYGMINDFAGRGYAEYAAVDADQLGRAPSSIDLRVAAAVPLAAQTALQALRDDGHVARGDEVLINGASGGVGVFAVQIAKILGANVTAVCSHRNIELVRELGADEVVDYTKTELVTLEQRFDAIFDVFGNYRFDKLKHLLKPRGTYVHTIPSSRIFKDVARTFVRKQRAKLVIVKSRRSQLDWLRQQIDGGRLRVVLDRSFPMRDVAEAHRYMETKRARGKVVLEVD